jgi:cysteine-rich repeat protein
MMLGGCGGSQHGDSADAGLAGANGLGYQVGTGGTGSQGGSSAHGTAPSGCGDGIINQPSEECDDGNTLAGDGCNGICRVEPNHVCLVDPNDPTRSSPCVVTFKCGDGIVNPGEQCDEGSYQGSPGCSKDCKTQELGYKCTPGQACIAQYTCGNGRIEFGESCDPPNPGGGCDANCKAELGWRCVPGSCTKLPYCGDGIVQQNVGEQCDEGTFQGSPGCSKDCLTQEPTCTCAPGKTCECPKAVCGDGAIQLGEQCDDKNGPFPGCSDSCQLEPGYQCPFAGAPCVPVCGDGIVVKPAEQCDPGSKVPNASQACYSTSSVGATQAACTTKPGWVCDDTSCRQTVCGDGKVEGTEGADNGTSRSSCTVACKLYTPIVD